jgi:hypothetical protein
MKGSFAISTLAAALLCGGCSQPVSPTGPSSVSSGSRLGLGAGAGARETAAASQAAREVPFKGSFAGTQSVTPLEPPLVFVNGAATGTATQLGSVTTGAEQVITLVLAKITVP